MKRGDDAEQGKLLIHQGAEKAARTGRACPGRFLGAEEQPFARHEAALQGVTASFDGGWEGAERTQVCFHPAQETPAFTLRWLEIRWAAKFTSVDHRSLLGSLMALGMDRSFLGDLTVQEDRAYLCALPEAALRLPGEWTKAGSTAIAVSLLEETPDIAPPHGVMLRDTVASLRLDSVLASGMKTSRSRASEIIRQGLVAVDHQAEERVDKVLEPGSLLSIRGFGRIRLVAVDRPTRKDRLPVTLELFCKS